MLLARYRPFIALTCVIALSGGCVGGSDDTTGASATSGSASDPTTDGGSMSSTGVATEPTATGTDTTTEATTDTTTEATTETTTETTVGTTGGIECDLEMIACELAEVGDSWIDCGVVDPWESTAEEWQAARQCAVDAVADEKAFKLITWLQGIDSEVGYAYVGFEGESYGIIRFLYDSYPPAGVAEQSCTSLTAEASCLADVGSVCLTCVDPGPNALVCGG